MHVFKESAEMIREMKANFYHLPVGIQRTFQISDGAFMSHALLNGAALE